MKFNFQHFLKAVLLGLFTLYFANLQITGDISKYVNPKYDSMSKIAAIFFAVLFLIQLTRMWQKKHSHHVCSHGCDHDHGNSQWSLKRIVGYSIVAFPIITGFTLPPATLDSSIAANKGFLLSQGNNEEKGGTSNKDALLEDAESLVEKENIDIYSSDDNLALPNNNYLSEEEYDKKFSLLQQSETIQMTDDMYSSYYEEINKNPKSYVGKTIKMSGFVFKEEGFASNQLVISRFLITHCIADASIIGFLTEYKGADTIKEDTWIEIEGILDIGSYGGSELPIIKIKSLNVIDEPSEPYVYPVLTLLQ